MRKKYTTLFIAVLLVSLLTVSLSSVFAVSKEIDADVNSQKTKNIELSENTQVFLEREDTVLYYDIVIYGGGLQAVAAAAKAAGTGPELSVALIAPYPNKELGGIATTGGQNYWDVRKFNNKLYQGGSFGWWYETFRTGYNVKEFSNYLIETIEEYDNITVYYCHDIRKVLLTEESSIKSIEIAGIYRDGDGFIRWANNEEGDIIINGNIFIDASEDCRLLRLSDNELDTEGSILTVGRYDWPEEYLYYDEYSSEGVGLQMSATLMFKVKGVECGSYSHMSFENNDSLAWGGGHAFANSEIIKEFNNKYGPYGFSIKGINAARNGEDSDEWWINSLVLYLVDARAVERDAQTDNYPDDMYPGSFNTDEAWMRGRQFLYEHAEEFMEAFHEFDGFHNAEFVYDSDGYPVVGDMLYIRESIHMVKNADLIGVGTEDTNYAVTASDSLFAGTDASNGADRNNYASRIGIGFYGTDVHPYIYHKEFFSCLDTRHDITGLSSYNLNPDYIPYEAIVNKEIPNLLVAGYGSGISSIAWSELRVFPNIIVMGDAAGVAAAYCGKNNLKPAFLKLGQINDIQSILVSSGAILDK